MEFYHNYLVHLWIKVGDRDVIHGNIHVIFLSITTMISMYYMYMLGDAAYFGFKPSHCFLPPAHDIVFILPQLFYLRDSRDYINLKFPSLVIIFGSL